jgi:hypothetical protein
VSGFFSRGEFDRAAVALILKAGLRIVSGDFTTACEDLICAAHLVEPVVHPVAALAVEEALGVVSPRRPGAREPLPSRMGLRAVTEFEATYPCQPEASEVLAFLRGAVGRYDRSRELLRSIAALPRLRERTA